MQVPEISGVAGVSGQASPTPLPDRPAPGPASPAPPPSAQSTSQPAVLPETYTRFVVNMQSGEVKVLVVDARTDEVLREIPPEELVRLRAQGAIPPGYLFQVEL